VTERFATVDDYISSFPPDARAVLTELREVIQGAIPDATERISYNMPAIG
jgi:uncharacterized protein YdhG (YjbR/CyaY superfamily)